MPSTECQTYHTKSKQSSYLFSYESQADGSERAYILDQPHYGHRAMDGYSTHRYFDNVRQLHYICFDPEPRSRNIMKKVASLWAEKTEAYRIYGQAF